MTAHVVRLAVPAAVAVALGLASAGAAGAQARGVVERVDVPITLQDGRVLHVTPRTTLWQPVPMTSVTPGASIHVRGGAPIDFRPGAPGPTSAVERDPMGVARRLP